MESYYRTLGLSDRQYDAGLTAQDIKQAYRNALLQHHPDKILDKNAESTFHTVDAITIAYKTLSEPVSKAEYDRALRLSQLSQSRNEKEDKIFHTGLDIVDLDDLQYDDASGTWWKGCRCGQERGFVITEDDLEKEARYGELYTGCRGCSLWLKVLFGVEEEAQAEDKQP